MIRPREIAKEASSVLQLFPVRTPTLPPATHTNSYALGARQVLLVEPSTPYEDEQRAWIEWARALVGSGRELVAVVATHHHVDHVGGAALLSRELGLPLWAHAETAARIDAPVARMLVDGEAITLAGPRDEVWQVLHTPGHAPGHVCLFEPRSRTVVVGDMVASLGTILIAPGDGDMRVYLAQLERLGALDASVALPAHGDPIAAPTALFAHYVKHRLAREEKIFGFLRQSAAALTAGKLVGLSYDDVPTAIWPIAKLSVEAHLEKLLADGRITVDAVRRMPSLPWYVDGSAMWKTSFVATAVAMGDDVDGALAVVVPGPETHALVTGLRAPQRAARAQALAEALHVVALAVDEVTLR